MGRPCKLTPALQEMILEAVRDGAYAEQAAAAAGIDRSTFFRWLAQGRDATSGKFREFSIAIATAEAAAELDAAKTLKTAFDGGDWRAAITYLERKFPERWGKRERHELSGPAGGPIQVDASLKVDLSKLSDEDLERLDEIDAKIAAQLPS